MKQFRILVILLIIAFVSCKQYNNPPIVFSAKVDNPNSDSLSIIKLFKDETLQTIHLDSNNTGQKSFYLPMAYYSLFDGNESTQIFLKPGYKLHLYLNAKEFDESIKYTGKGAAENNYLAQKTLLEEKLGKLVYYGYYAALNEKDFLHLVDSIYNLQLNLFNKYGKDFDKDFKYIELHSLKIDRLSKIKDFEGMHRYVTGDTSFAVSDTFPKVFDNINEYLNNERLLIMPFFNNFIESYVTSILSSIYRKDKTIDYYNVFLDILDTTVSSDKIKERLASDFIKYKFKKVKDYEAAYKKLLKLDKNKEDVKQLNEIYEKVKKIQNGQVSPSFELYDIDSNLVKLSDFRGKLVYIDVWAPWCLPCRKSIPYFEELKEEYKDKDVAFVSICRLYQRDKWAKTVKLSELTGVQLFAPEPNQFISDYMIDGVPYYILIDKEGKILEKSAPRPENTKEIKKLLDENL